MMKDAMSKGMGGGVIRITERSLDENGNTVVTQRVMNMPGGDSTNKKNSESHDEDDDEGVPPEILQMMKMTESLLNGGMFRPPVPHFPKLVAKKPEGPREEESVDSIMERMNKLSEEIGEKSEQRKKY
jgi:hypothetical protein